MSCTSSSQQAPILDGWKQTAAKKSQYIVQSNDTLYSIAWAFGMDFRELAKINHLKSPYQVYSGQKLVMASGSDKVSLNNLPTPSIKNKIIKKNQIDGAKTEINATISNGVWKIPAEGLIVKKFSLTQSDSKGIEIAGRLGEPIVASNSGVVVYSGNGLRGYGNLIIIKHNDTFLSAYAYNKALLIKEGNWVKKGQRIALMGTNAAGQVRLHFEIRKNGQPVDPVLFCLTGSQ